MAMTIFRRPLSLKIASRVTLSLSVVMLVAQLPAFADNALTVASVLKPFVDRHELAGAVTLVTSPKKVLSIESIGYADIAAQKPMQTDSLFWIASMSKPIAASAVMMLVDERKIRLDDPVDKYLPQFTPRIIEIAADGVHASVQQPRITLRNLLSHTAGIPFSSS